MISRNRAFSLVEIMIVVAIIGILLAVSVPAYIRAREGARQTTCQENLIQIDSAIERYAIDENVPAGAAIAVDLNYLVDEKMYIRRMPICPSGGTYSFTNIDDNPPVTCSISFESIRPHVLPQILSELEGGGGS